MPDERVPIQAGLTAPALDDPAWKELRPGVRIRVLHDDEPTGYRVAMLHYQPGASVPKMSVMPNAFSGVIEMGMGTR